MKTDLNRIPELIPEEYEIKNICRIKDIGSTGVILSHKKSGARVAAVLNDDDNKVFSVAFRTPPTNSKGIPHIVEHSVLCGSKKYPLRDPFIELEKGSLKTFLNAFTYPDKTVYPVASCNDKDFCNLCDVYMDAVFNPRIYEMPGIFMQEGIRHEVKEDGSLSYNGVVYNEMKGAFSSADQILERGISQSLFPDTAYGVESGGEPSSIEKLTREEFLDFHKRFYHPANSYIAMYGDIDLKERLEWLNREYLSAFKKDPVDSELTFQKPFEKTGYLELSYPASTDMTKEGHDHFSFNAVYGKYDDLLTITAMDILSYILIDSASAVLKNKLLERGVCKDVLGGNDSGVLEPYFYIAVKDSDIKDGAEYERIVKECLNEIIEEKIDPVSIKAAISRFEFQYREADYSSFPKGLVYILNMYDCWLYDDDKVFDSLERIKIFDRLKEYADTDYFMKLIREKLIDNPFSSVLVVRPDTSFAKNEEERVKRSLEEFRTGLTDAEYEELKEEYERFKVFQQRVDTKEALKSLPVLKKEDLRREIIKPSNNLIEKDGYKFLWHDHKTNGIIYTDILFDINEISPEDLKYLKLFTICLGYMSAGDINLVQLDDSLNLLTGDFSVTLKYSKGNYHLDVCLKTLSGNNAEALELVRTILLETDFSDKGRLYNIILESCSQKLCEFTQGAHSAALRRAAACIFPREAFAERCSGIEHYEFLLNAGEKFEQLKDEIVEALYGLKDKIITSKKILFSVTCDEADRDKAIEELKTFGDSLPKKACGLQEKEADGKKTVKLVDADLRYEKCNEAIRIPGNVNYAARVGKGRFAHGSYTGTLQVLRTILSFDYLWKNVREKGGAYGCMNSFRRDGLMGVVSYRDPNLKSTDEVYKKIPEYVESFNADDEDFFKYIIGTISTSDIPLTPCMKGASDLTIWLMGYTDEERQKNRDEIIDALPSDIRKLAGDIKEALADSAFCVFGNEKSIEDSKEMFDKVTPLKFNQ